MKTLILLFAVWALSTQAGAAEIGFEHVEIPGPAGATMAVSIWYPTSATPTLQIMGPYQFDAAMDGPIEGTALPLIVVSHGNGGTSLGHYDTDMALARSGFVVAAITHPGDNYRDHDRELFLQDRAPQISAMLDYMLGAWHDHAAIRTDRIGMFGFSAGGFTTLVAIGAKPDMARIGPYCASHPDRFVCTLVRSHGEAPAPPAASAWIADPRIKAAVIAAPGPATAFTKEGLRDVTVPVQLWGAGADQVLPDSENVDVVRAGLPGKVEYHLVPGAGHFDFLAPCSKALARAAPPICSEAGGFDRIAFHRDFDAAVVGFFQRVLMHR